MAEKRPKTSAERKFIALFREIGVDESNGIVRKRPKPWKQQFVCIISTNSAKTAQND